MNSSKCNTSYGFYYWNGMLYDGLDRRHVHTNANIVRGLEAVRNVLLVSETTQAAGLFYQRISRAQIQTT